MAVKAVYNMGQTILQLLVLTIKLSNKLIAFIQHKILYKIKQFKVKSKAQARLKICFKQGFRQYKQAKKPLPVYVVLGNQSVDFYNRYFALNFYSSNYFEPDLPVWEFYHNAIFIRVTFDNFLNLDDWQLEVFASLLYTHFGIDLTEAIILELTNNEQARIINRLKEFLALMAKKYNCNLPLLLVAVGVVEKFNFIKREEKLAISYPVDISGNTYHHEFNNLLQHSWQLYHKQALSAKIGSEELLQMLSKMSSLANDLKPLLSNFWQLTDDNSYLLKPNLAGVYVQGDDLFTVPLSMARFPKRLVNSSFWLTSAITLLSVIFILQAFMFNYKLLHSASKFNTIGELLPLHSALKTAHKLPWYRNLGFYKAGSEIEVVAHKVQTMFQEHWLPIIIAHYNKKLQQMHNKWQYAGFKEKLKLRNDYYNLLRNYSYLMIKVPASREQLKESLPKDILLADEIKEFALDNWQKIVSGADNSSVFLQAQNDLASLPLGEIFEHYMRQQELIKKDILLTANEVGFKKELPYIYTNVGFDNLIFPYIAELSSLVDKNDPLLKDRVVGDSYKYLIELYKSRANIIWSEHIASINIKQFYDLGDSVQRLNDFANSGFLNLIKYINNNLPVTAKTSRDESAVGIINLEYYLAGLKTIQYDLAQILASTLPEEEILQYLKTTLPGKEVAASNLRKVVDSMDKAINNEINSTMRKQLLELLLLPIKEVWRLLLQQAVAAIEVEWDNKVVLAFQEHLEGKYPFASNSDLDANLNDIIDFFRPEQGVLWDFINNNLAQLLHKEKNRWVGKSWLGIAPKFRVQFLETLVKAEKISNDFFIHNKNMPTFKFAVMAQPIADALESTLELGNNKFRYRNEPQEWHNFEWPQQNSIEGAKISVLLANNKKVTIAKEGLWALFRLLEQAQDKHLAPGNMLKASWQMGNLDSPLLVTYIIKLERSGAFLQEVLFNKFSLPILLAANERVR